MCECVYCIIFFAKTDLNEHIISGQEILFLNFAQTPDLPTCEYGLQNQY